MRLSDNGCLCHCKAELRGGVFAAIAGQPKGDQAEPARAQESMEPRRMNTGPSGSASESQVPDYQVHSSCGSIPSSKLTGEQPQYLIYPACSQMLTVSLKNRWQQQMQQQPTLLRSWPRDYPAVNRSHSQPEFLFSTPRGRKRHAKPGVPR